MDIVPLLQFRDVSLVFGGVTALNQVSFEVNEQQICGLIGPNGAGKTTIFNCISRFYDPIAGSIHFKGQNILELPAHRMALLGIGRTFQNVALFPSLSVTDNILTGAHSLLHGRFVADALRLPVVRSDDAQVSRVVDELVEMLDLASVRDARVSELPFGTRKRVELARALAGRPKLLLLDEPAGGLNHDEVDRLRGLILMLRDSFHITILLVEHHLNLVMRVSDRVIALDFGQTIADGTPAEVRANAEVIRAYLGSDE
jgi:branched-chain amino acid transport system ATP-binding protein